MSSDEEERLIRDVFEKLGIRGYELKAYLTILRLGEETAPTIASKAGIPLPRVYDVLESLLNKGLIEVRMGRPRRYRALPPRISLANYVRKKISELTELTNTVIERLSSYYMGSSGEKEPFLWVMYNVDVGIDKAKHVIAEMNIDGYMSLSTSVLKRVITTITRTLAVKNNSVLGITVLSEDIPPSLRDAIEKIDNLALRMLPTGIVNMVETDSSELILFGKNYVIHSGEWELIVLANESFYHGYWRIAKKVKDVVIKKEVKYKTTHHWLALDIVSSALENGYNVYMKVKGFQARSHEPVEVEGYVRKLYVTPDRSIRSIYVEDEKGNIVSVGGLGATVEDVEARYLELTIQ